jgi:hypothetical protein
MAPANKRNSLISSLTIKELSPELNLKDSIIIVSSDTDEIRELIMDEQHPNHQHIKLESLNLPSNENLYFNDLYIADIIGFDGFDNEYINNKKEIFSVNDITTNREKSLFLLSLVQNFLLGER